MDASNRSKASSASARPAKLQQRHAAAVEQFGIVRLETQAFVKTDQRPLEIPQRVKHHPETGKAIGAKWVAFQRFLKQRKRCVEPTAPVVDLPETVQRVEIVGVMLEDFPVKPFSLGEFAVLESAPRALERPRGIGLRALRRLAAHQCVQKNARAGRALAAADH